MKKQQWIVRLAVLLTGLVFGPVAAQDMDMTGGALPPETRLLISDVRSATTGYHELDIALEDGYGIFQDCFKDGAVGGMGQHYVHGGLAGDDQVDPLRPEALVYEPRPDGELTLVALEYIIFADVWDPDGEGREPPTLFGQPFHLKTTIPDTPPLWALHIWLFTHNPEGMFADYNPTVFCPEDRPSAGT